VAVGRRNHEQQEQIGAQAEQISELWAALDQLSPDPAISYDDPSDPNDGGGGIHPGGGGGGGGGDSSNSDGDGDGDNSSNSGGYSLAGGGSSGRPGVLGPEAHVSAHQRPAPSDAIGDEASIGPPIFDSGAGGAGDDGSSGGGDDCGDGDGGISGGGDVGGGEANGKKVKLSSSRDWNADADAGTDSDADADA
jgi:hypothetical protein